MRSLVEIWLIKADQHFDTSIFSPVEARRASQFLDPLARNRFVASRHALRVLLAERLEIPAADVRLVLGDHGKPRLRHPVPLQFNVSHSETFVAIALSMTRPVGIDLERVRKRPGLIPIALSPKEAARLRVLPTAVQAEALLQAWTAKEAHLKAVGTGVTRHLVDIEPRIATPEPGCLEPGNDEMSGVDGWGLKPLPLPAGYVGSVVARGHHWRLAMRAWLDNRPQGP